MSLLIKMIPLPRKALLGLGIVVLAAGFTSQASAGIGETTSRALSACQPFPKVGVWQNLSHDSVREQVEREYGDDWHTYIGRLEVYGSKLRRIQAKGRSARIIRGGRNVRLQGEALTRFLVFVDKRIAVTRCLAENQPDTLDIAGIAAFSTAAGGTDGEYSYETTTSEIAGLGTGKTKKRNRPDKCGPVPQIDWWTFKSHDSITRYVSKKYQGDWTPYIAKWDNRLRKLKDIQNRGSGAVTKTGNTLKGAALAAYIRKTQDRIAVTRCLAKLSGASKT